MPPPEKLKRKLVMPEKLLTPIANTIWDADGHGRTGVALYALATILRMGRVWGRGEGRELEKKLSGHIRLVTTVWLCLLIQSDNNSLNAVQAQEKSLLFYVLQPALIFSPDPFFWF